MGSYGEFHDGWFNGILVEETSAYVFVTTYGKQRYVFVASGVLALAADEIMSGNIILDLSIRPATEVTTDELTARSAIRSTHSSASIDGKLLDLARERNLNVLTIDPSYGATCLILAASFEQINREEWSNLKTF